MKIKEYFQQIEPKVAPTPTAQPELGVARGIGQLGQALGGAASDWEEVAKTYRAIEEKQKEYDDQDSALNISTEAEKKFSDILDQYSKSDPAGHEKIIPEGTEALEKIKTDAMELAKNPEVSRLINRKLMIDSTNASIKLRDIKNEKWIDYHLGSLAETKQRLEDTIPDMQEKVTMPDGSVAYPRENQITHFNRYVDDLSKQLGHKFSPKDAQNMKESFRENIAVNAAKTAIMVDPLGAMEKLDKGEIGKGIPADKVVPLQQFAESQLRMKEAAARQKEADINRTRDKERKNYRNSIQSMIEAGDSTGGLSLAQGARDHGLLDYDDVKWVRDEIKSFQDANKKAVAEEDDGAAKEIYSLIDRGKFAEAKKKAGEANIKPATYNSMLGEIRTIKNHWDDKATSEQKYRHSQAKAVLGTSLGIIEGQIMERLEPLTKETYDLALREFTKRSNATGGGEDPLTITDEIIPKYQSILLDRQKIGVENYRKLLRFNTPGALEDAYKSGKISKGEYDSQKDIAIRFQEAQKEAKRLEATKRPSKRREK